MSVLQYGSLINQVATTVTSGGTTTLVNTSAMIQIFTGTMNQTLVLPVATTFTKPGISYQFYNFSTGTVSVEYQDATALQTIPADSTLIINCYNASTANGQWTTLTNSTVPSVNAPTQQIFLSGSGTYTTPTSPSPLYIRVIGVGGGSGGQAANASGATGVAGNNTTFGTSLLVGNGGAVQTGSGGGSFNGGAGGTASLGSGPIGFTISGGSGTGSGDVSSVAAGGAGGNSPFGGAGGGGSNPGAGFAAATNSGSGGGGGGGVPDAGAGGGAGGYFNAVITSPSSTYAYVVGSGGTGGSAGGGQGNGGDGGDGIIIVEEYYQ